MKTEVAEGERLGGLRRIPRTALLAGLGVLAAAGLAYADVHWGKHQWPSAPTELIGLPAHTKEATLTFPGLGSLDGENQARHADKLLGSGTGAHWRYSSDGISVASLAEALQQQAPELNKAHLNGHSMGGPLSLETVREAKIPGLKLGRVVLHCSPFDIKDARNNRAASVARALNWQNGPGTKFGAAYIKNRLLDGQTRPMAFQQARHDAKNGCSPRLWISQINTLHGFDLMSHLDEYRTLVGPDTELIYCMPENPKLDRTVDTVQASERYRVFCEELGIPYQVVEIPEMGHAEVGKAYQHLGTVAQKASGFIRPSPDVS